MLRVWFSYYDNAIYIPIKNTTAYTWISGDGGDLSTYEDIPNIRTSYYIDLYVVGISLENK